jgi:hypothetical protein
MYIKSFKLINYCEAKSAVLVNKPPDELIIYAYGNKNEETAILFAKNTSQEVRQPPESPERITTV